MDWENSSWDHSSTAPSAFPGPWVFPFLLDPSHLLTPELFHLLNRWTCDCILAGICWLICPVGYTFLGVSGLSLAPSGVIEAISLVSLTHFLYVESFAGKSKSALRRDSKEYTLWFCWRRVRLFFSIYLSRQDHTACENLAHRHASIFMCNKR